MANIIKWPKPIPITTRRCNRVKMPTVVTSEKWLEIKRAQDNEKKTKRNKKT